MPEDSYTGIGALFFDHAGKQSEVIVLRQHQRVLCASHFVNQRVGEFLIYGAVLLPILGAEQRAGMGDVAERPEAFVSEAEIEAFLFLPREPDPAKGVLGMVGRNAKASGGIRSIMVRRTRALSDPQTIAGAQNRLERGHQAAGWNGPFQRSVFIEMFVRLTV